MCFECKIHYSQGTLNCQEYKKRQLEHFQLPFLMDSDMIICTVRTRCP